MPLVDCRVSSALPPLFSQQTHRVNEMMIQPLDLNRVLVVLDGETWDMNDEVEESRGRTRNVRRSNPV